MKNLDIKKHCEFRLMVNEKNQFVNLSQKKINNFFKKSQNQHKFGQMIVKKKFYFFLNNCGEWGGASPKNHGISPNKH